MTRINLSPAMRACVEPCTRVNYFLVTVLLFIPLIPKYFLPNFHVNEAGKLISVRQLFEPDFLSHDWVVAKGHGDNIFDFAYSAALAPLWVCLHNMLLVALVARVLFWIAFLLILAKLGKRLKLEPYVILIATAVWILLRQCLGAQEWVLGGIEPKCFSYALLLLALIAVFDKATLKAGIYCGLAITFHVLVGMWGTFAIGLAVLAAWREFGWRKIFIFGLLPALINLPLFLIAMRYDAAGTSAERAAAAQIGVMFADPLHLDPDYFNGKILFGVLVLMTAGCWWLSRRIVPAFEARLLSGFVTALTLVYGAGLVAWHLRDYRFLLTFPFRVGDVLVLLIFLLALTCWVGRKVLAWFDGSRWKRLPLGWKNAVCVVLVVLFVGVYANRLYRPMVGFTQDWRYRLDRQHDTWREMTDWIRTETPKDAVFLSPPWMNIFWIDAERAQVANYKRAPHNYQIIEWQRRLEEANGRPVQERGVFIMKELMRNYPKLSVAEIDAIRDKYGASYYLTTVERPEMSGQLVHGNGEYFLYRLDTQAK